MTGRQIAKSPATIDADLTAALRQSLAPLRPTGSVDVSVQVLKLRLFAPQEEIFIGGTSHIQALVRVTDVKTGRDVMSLDAEELRVLRSKNASIVYQDPGQALAYMIGKLKIDELRDKAAAVVGPDGLGETHHVVDVVVQAEAAMAQ